MTELQITILGCDGSYPGPDGACSGYLLRTESTSVYLDAGDGTLANLQKHMSPAELDAVVLSHEHPDHCANIRDLKVFGMCGQPRFENLPVYAPPGLRESLFPDSDLEPHLVWTEIEDADVLEIGDLKFTFSRTDHGPYTLAARVDIEERTFVYSSDTGDGWSFSALGDHFDLAFCEAAIIPEDEEKRIGHLSARQAGRMAREAGVERLVLTHLRPWQDHAQFAGDAATAFGRPVEVAQLGTVYTL